MKANSDIIKVWLTKEKLFDLLKDDKI